MNRINRKAYILSELQCGPATAYRLAQRLDCPEASVRRSIQQLRADGHNISFSLVGMGEYRLGVSTTIPIAIKETFDELSPAS